MIALHPLPGRILVEIREKYSHTATLDQKYDTKTSGICLSELETDGITRYELEGKLVFWQEYKEGAIIERDSKKYAFIKIEDLDGYEDVKTD